MQSMQRLFARSFKVTPGLKAISEADKVYVLATIHCIFRCGGQIRFPRIYLGDVLPGGKYAPPAAHPLDTAENGADPADKGRVPRGSCSNCGIVVEPTRDFITVLMPDAAEWVKTYLPRRLATAMDA